MPRHQDAGYDDYEDGDYGEEDLSPADAERYDHAVVTVKSRLGRAAASFSDEEIRETVYYYYFDVEQSVAYLQEQLQKKEAKAAASRKSGPSSRSNGSDEPSTRAPVSKIQALARNDRRRQNHNAPPPSGQDTQLDSKPADSKSAPASRPMMAKDGTKKPLSKLAHLAASKKRAASTAAPRPPESSTDNTIPAESNMHATETAESPESPVVPMPSIFNAEAALQAVPSVFAQSLFQRNAEELPGDRDAEVGHASSADDTLFVLVPPTDLGRFERGTTVQTVQPKPKGAEKVSEGISGLSIDDKQESGASGRKPQVRAIDVVTEYERSGAKELCQFVVIGHVDSGKSTLMGHLLSDLGYVDDRLLRNYKKESAQRGKSSFAYAWVLDATEEERSHGVTIDTASTSFATDKRRYVLLDAPGHRDYIPSMISGASQADVAVLVIDASPGGFESGYLAQGQTREHTLLVRALGISSIIVVVNKLDTVAWARDRFDDIKSQLSAFLLGAGYKPENTYWVPCSGMSGGNLVHRMPSDSQLATWYTGESFLETLDLVPTGRSNLLHEPLRMTISDVYKGHGTVVVSGRVETGTIQQGETVLLAPSSETAVVKSVSSDTTYAVSGDAVDVQLSDIDIMHIKAGDVLCDPEHAPARVISFEAKIITFELDQPILQGVVVALYQNRASTEARIEKLIATMTRAQQAVVKKSPRFLGSNVSATVQVSISGSPLPMTTYEECRALGRIVLRREGKTIAAGVIDRITSAA